LLFGEPLWQFVQNDSGLWINRARVIVADAN
jgi:hypothetical protein